MKGEVLGNLVGRGLQYELDRHEREDRDAVDAIKRDLLAAAVDVVIGFIDKETLVRWREISVEVLSRPLDWDRFGVMASRHLRAYGVESEADLAHFLRNIPDLLDQSIRQVTPARIEAFQERSRHRAAAAIREYLS